MEKIFNQKNFHYFFWTPLVVELAYSYIFFFKFVLSCQQFDNCSYCLPPVSTTLAKLVEKFVAGVVDTGGKFATGVVEYSGVGGKLIHEKNQKQKTS
jgi:hypothetical protein